MEGTWFNHQNGRDWEWERRKRGRGEREKEGARRVEGRGPRNWGPKKEGEGKDCDLKREVQRETGIPMLLEDMVKKLRVSPS